MMTPATALTTIILKDFCKKEHTKLEIPRAIGNLLPNLRYAGTQVNK